MTNPLKRLAEARFRISAQLYAGISAAVALTMIASLVAWFSFSRVGDAQSSVNELVPDMEAAFGIAQRAGALVVAAPRLAAVATREDLDRITARLETERREFEIQLAAFQGADSGRHDRTRDLGGALIDNIGAMERLVAERIALAARGQGVLADVGALQDDLTRILVPAIDDQLFYAMTGYRRMGEAPAARQRRLSEVEINRYRHLSGMHADVTIGIQLLASAFDLSDKARLDPLRDRFQAAADRIERSLEALGDGPVRRDIAQSLAHLRELGLGQEGGIELRIRELVLAERQKTLLADNQDLVAELVREVQDLVTEARRSAENATGAATDAILTGRGLLLSLNAISIVGAGLIAWLFVGRVLLRRLERLSERMRGMADGDLEAEIDITGRDEVADMAAALEVFRRHALEVQRLDLVEKLAEELSGKNNQLETALADLRRAQDQIVAREKLAALGGLTAGVAHEIKNPLNFVKNFSEASEELLEELLETLREGGEKLSDEQRGLVREICQDLTENLGRIRNHGNRADRIVRDMLMMGRSTGDKQPTDVNGLLEEHARLAFHSARADDPDFQLEIEQDLDPTVGEIEVVPQDLGRVFLNMVSNACHATDERHRAARAGGSPYAPTLRLASRRLDDRIEVSIRDNGNGIPPDVMDKIFTPFFTTKPTDQGAGLGLALSNDIVREHGGTIRVESEPGSFTEMVVEIPLAAAAHAG